MYDFDQLVETKEKIYFGIMLIISILLYTALFISIVGIGYLLAGALAIYCSNGLYIGYLKQNAVKVSKNQFGDIYAIVENYSKQLQLKKIPEIYVLQSGGVLNAMVCRFRYRNFMIIFSNVLELAYEQGEEAVKFIVAHELAHIKRKHLSKRVFVLPGMLIPFLSSAYSRSCEFTCDNIAARLASVEPTKGLLLLLAGQKLYNKVDTNEFLSESKKEKDFWTWFAEIISSHPSLSSRLAKRIASH
ncbi:MAG: M48 family metallopeptidase [Holosporaceae bacterium]|jgi:Zn-dependent protease with chaperone function|nr:M48 family metallopeptidase [Holosporaceae bacterium]